MTKVSLPVLVVPARRQKGKPPKALPPVPYWTMKKARLARSSQRVVNALRRSDTTKMAVKIAVSICVARILDPKGTFITRLSNHKTWGQTVKELVSHESYHLLTQRIVERSAEFATRGFSSTQTVTLPPEDVQVVSEHVAVTSSSAVSHPWSSASPDSPTVTTVTFR